MASNSWGNSHPSSHLNLSTTEVDQARKAIEFLSSLCSGTSEVSHSSSSSNESIAWGKKFYQSHAHFVCLCIMYHFGGLVDIISMISYSLSFLCMQPLRRELMLS